MSIVKKKYKNKSTCFRLDRGKKITGNLHTDTEGLGKSSSLPVPNTDKYLKGAGD